MKFSLGVALAQKQEHGKNIATSLPPMPENSKISNNIDNLVEYAKGSRKPIVLLNEDQRIFFKNKYINKILPKLENGERINRFLSEETSFSIEQMQDRQILKTKFSKDELCFNSTIISHDGCYMVVLDHIGAEIGNAVSESLQRTSGYDIALPVPVGIKDLRGFDHRAANEILHEAIERYKTIQPIPFFKSTDIIKNLFDRLKKDKPEIFESINLNFSEHEHTSSGSERDFVLLIACATAFCVAISRDQKVSVEVFGGNDFNKVSVWAYSASDEKTITDFSDIRNFKDIKNEETGWIYLLKILSGINLWNISTIAEKSGKIGFLIELRVSDEFENFALQDVAKEFLSNIISRIFTKIS